MARAINQGPIRNDLEGRLGDPSPRKTWRSIAASNGEYEQYGQDGRDGPERKRKLLTGLFFVKPESLFGSGLWAKLKILNGQIRGDIEPSSGRTKAVSYDSKYH